MHKLFLDVYLKLDWSEVDADTVRYLLANELPTQFGREHWNGVDRRLAEITSREIAAKLNEHRYLEEDSDWRRLLKRHLRLLELI